MLLAHAQDSGLKCLSKNLRDVDSQFVDFGPLVVHQHIMYKGEQRQIIIIIP